VCSEEEISARSLVIFVVFMVAKFVELPTVQIVFSMCMCFLMLCWTINCEHYVCCEKIWLSEIGLCSMQRCLVNLCCNCVVTVA
jgi:hypothetical protein